MHNDHEAEIVDVVTAYVRAWTAGDLEGWSALFTADSDFITWAGLWWRTRAENLAGHQAAPEHVRAQMIDYHARVSAVELLAADIGLVHVSWTWPSFRPEPDAQPEDRSGIITMIMIRRDGHWSIRASHNSRSR